MVCWHLERCLTALDGGQFFDRCRQLVIAAIGTALDDVLEAMEEWRHAEERSPPETRLRANHPARNHPPLLRGV